MNGSVKTEHNGAKNGGGYWGRRVEAKAVTKRLRRANAKLIVREALASLPKQDEKE